MRINLALDARRSCPGLPVPILWDFQRIPHLAIFGATGSGKTYLTKLIIARIGKHIPDSEVIICDFKGDDDFSFLEGKRNFFRYDECRHGLENALKKLHDRQQGRDRTRTFYLFFFDEWASYLNYLEKKQAEEEKKKLSLLLMLGRSFNIHVMISQQRADASYFNAARDNFGVIIGLGRLSRESIQMMFPDFKEDIDAVKPRGYGSAVVGGELYEVLVPCVRDEDALRKAISAAVAEK